MAAPSVMNLFESDAATKGYQAPYCTLHGSATSTMFAPTDYSLWALSADVAKGSSLSWSEEHGDEAVFVVNGSLSIDGQKCSNESAIVLEAGTPVTLTAEEDTKVIHLGPADPTPRADGPFGPPEPSGHRVHLVNSEGAYRRTAEGRPVDAVVFADSNCKTCRINFFRLVGTETYRTPSHVHSENEIIVMLSGEIQVGRERLKAGSAIAVPGGYRYGLQSTGPFSFLNYRSDMSTFQAAPSDAPRLESMRPEGIDF